MPHISITRRDHELRCINKADNTPHLATTRRGVAVATIERRDANALCEDSVDYVQVRPGLIPDDFIQHQLYFYSLLLDYY